VVLSRTPRRLTDRQRELAEELIAEHGDGLWNLALVVAGSRQAAEDLLAAALIRALPHLDRMTVPAPIYLRTVMLNLRATEWRRRKGFTVSPYAELPESTTGRDEAATAALRTDVAEALGALAPRQRAVVALRYLEDRSISEVAQILGCSEATVRSQAHRGLAHLRNAPWLAHDTDDEPTRSTS